MFEDSALTDAVREAHRTGREARLPAWTRDLIASLRRRVIEAEAADIAARLATLPSESNTVVDAYADVPIGLGVSPTVRFYVGDARRDDWIDARVIMQGRDVVLNIMAASSITVAPRSGNVVEIAVIR